MDVFTDCSLKTGRALALLSVSGSTFTLILMFLLTALLMRVAGELVASGRLIAFGLGECTISSSSLNFGFFVLANCGDSDLSGSLYACCCRSTSPVSSRMFSMHRSTCFIFISQSRSERIFGRQRLYVGLYVAVITEGLAG